MIICIAYIIFVAVSYRGHNNAFYTIISNCIDIIHLNIITAILFVRFFTWIVILLVFPSCGLRISP